MLKKILLALVVVLVAVGAGVPAFMYTAYPKMRPAPAVKAPSTPEAV